MNSSPSSKASPTCQVGHQDYHLLGHANNIRLSGRGLGAARRHVAKHFPLSEGCRGIQQLESGLWFSPARGLPGRPSRHKELDCRESPSLGLPPRDPFVCSVRRQILVCVRRIGVLLLLSTGTAFVLAQLGAHSVVGHTSMGFATILASALKRIGLRSHRSQ